MTKTILLFTMSEKTFEKSETKVCESCGKKFDCGVNSEKCWCFEIDLSQEILTELQKNFKNCLCKDCLQAQHKNVHRPD